MKSYSGALLLLGLVLKSDPSDSAITNETCSFTHERPPLGLVGVGPSEMVRP